MFRLFLFLALAALCQGQPVYWSGVDGDWFETQKWYGAAVPGVNGSVSSGDVAYNGKYTVTISQNLAVNVPLLFGDPSGKTTVMISIPPSRSVSFSSVTVSEGVTFNISEQSTLSIGTITINSPNGVSVIGGGNLTFTGPVTFDGQFTSTIAPSFANVFTLQSGQVTLPAGGSCSGTGGFSFQGTSVLALPVTSAVTTTCKFYSTGGGGNLWITANHTLSGGVWGVKTITFDNGVSANFQTATTANNIVAKGGAKINVATNLTATRVEVGGDATLTLESGSINGGDVIVGNGTNGTIKLLNSSLKIDNLQLFPNALPWVANGNTFTVGVLGLNNFTWLDIANGTHWTVTSNLSVWGDNMTMVNITGGGTLVAKIALSGGVSVTVSTPSFDSDQIIVDGASWLTVASNGSCSNGTIWLGARSQLLMIGLWNFAACFPQGMGSFQYAPMYNVTVPYTLPAAAYSLGELIFGAQVNLTLPVNLNFPGALVVKDMAQGWIPGALSLGELRVFDLATVTFLSNLSLSNVTIGNVPYYPIVAIAINSSVTIDKLTIISGKIQVDPHSTLHLNVTNVQGGEFYIDEDSTLSMANTSVDATFASFSGSGQLRVNETSALTMNAFAGRLIISSGYFHLGGKLSIATGGVVSLAAVGDCISSATNQSIGKINVVSAAELEVTGDFDFDSCTISGGSATLSYSSTLPITYSLDVTSSSITQIKVTNAATIIIQPAFQIPSAVVDGTGTMVINGTHTFIGGVTVINGTLQLIQGAQLTGTVMVGTDGDTPDFVPVLVGVNATSATVTNVILSGYGKIESINSALTVNNVMMNNGTAIDGVSAIAFGTIKTNGSVQIKGASVSANSLQVLGGSAVVTTSNLIVKAITLASGSSLEFAAGSSSCPAASTISLGSTSKLIVSGAFDFASCIPSGNGSLIYKSTTAKQFSLLPGTYAVNAVETQGQATLTSTSATINGDVHLSGSSNWNANGALTIKGHLQVDMGTSFSVLAQGSATAATATFVGTYKLNLASKASTAILSVTGNATLTSGSLLLAPTFSIPGSPVVLLKYGQHDGNFSSSAVTVTPPKNFTLEYSETQLTIRDEHASSAASLRPPLLLLALLSFLLFV